MFPGIPSLISKNYFEVVTAVVTAILVFIIHFWKIIPRNYVQFLVAVTICTFNNNLFFYQSNSLDNVSKSSMFFRGYAYASINVGLLTRISSLTQKIVFLIYEFVFRVGLLIYLDGKDYDILTIVRNLYVDMFLLYILLFNEKKVRSVFKSFYEYREELLKFKQLLSDYFPQSIAVFNPLMEKPLFLNQAFTNIFGQNKEELISPNNSQNIHILDNSKVVMAQNLKLDLRTLQVEKNTIREVGTIPSNLMVSDTSVYLQDFIIKLMKSKALDQKPLCFSASYSSDTESKLFEVVATKIKWDGEEAVVVMLSDITYQEKIISLKIADANKDQIIATVSHELRTPLSGIIGILGMAEKRITDGKVLEYLGLCKDNAHLLLGLVNSLLDLNQVRQGKLRLNPMKIDVNQVFSEVVRLFVYQCNNKGIYLKLNILKGVPTYIYTDDNRLKQILINLIGNAIKFTLKGGITVEVAKDTSSSQFLQISVIDTGIGIKEEDTGKLFQMYEKIEHGRSVNKNGVGLGLSISNTLAGLLSGRTGERAIEVESNLHEGSKFTFKILKDLTGQSPREEQEKIHLSLDYLDDSSVLCSQEEFQKAKENGNVLFPCNVEKYTFSKHDSSLVLADKRNLSKPKLSAFSPLNARGISQLLTSKPENPSYISVDKMNPKDTVLVVDDNAFNLLVVENMIKEIGYSFLAAKSGPEAIETVKLKTKEYNRIAAILMDCQMPIMDGFETTRILRGMMNQGEVPNIPIIALTANNGEEDIKQCYSSGMVAHLSKPLFAKALLKILEGLS